MGHLKVVMCNETNYVKYAILRQEINEVRMRKIGWKNRILFSYIFAGVLPLLVLGTFFYYGNRAGTRQELEKSNSACLEQVLQKLDYVTEKMSSTAYHFSGTEMAAQLDRVRNQKMDIDEGMVISQLATYAKIVADEERLPQMLLYLRGDKYIYTSEGRIAYHMFEQDMAQYGNLNLASFYTTISSTVRDRTIWVENEKSRKAITWFLYPVPYMNNIPVATLGFGYETTMLEEMVKSYYPLESAVYLFNRQLQPIYVQVPDSFTAAEREAIEDLVLEYRKAAGYSGEQKNGGNRYVVMRKISANSGFTLVSVTKSKTFYQHDDIFGKWLIAGVLALFAGGVMLAVVLSHNTYEPIQKLMDKNKELNALVNRQRPMVLASCLRGILKGRFQSREEMEATLKSAAVRLDYRYHFVILLPIPVEKEFDSEKSLQILSVLEDGAYPRIHLYGLDMLKDDGIAVLVNSQEKEWDGKDIRITVANHLQHELRAKYGMELPFYIGRLYEDPMSISRSFIEATALAADYRMLGNQKIILFEEICGEKQDMQYPVLEQAVYIQCLKQANETAALAALDNMVQEIEPMKSFLLMQCLCFDIINVTIKTLDQMKGFELENVDMKKVCSFANLSEFRERMGVLASEICRQYARFKDSQNNALKAGVLTYVNQHFGDSSMGLEAVAEQFGVSVNFMSRFFKQETGCNFIQYVTMIRMDCAKELLINSDIQIKDIVAQIGYIDVANFVRKFKNYEGVTPGQYREKMRKSKG